MKLKKIIVVSLACMLLVGLVGYMMYKQHIQNELKNYKAFGEYTGKAQLENYVKIKDSAIATKWKVTSNQIEYDAFMKYFKWKDNEKFPVIVSENYVVRQNKKNQNNFGYYGKSSHEGDYWTLDVYDLKNKGEKIASYDVFKDIVKTDFISDIGTIMYDNKGNEHLIFYLSHSEDLKDRFYRVLELSSGITRDIDEKQGTIDGYKDAHYPIGNLIHWTNLVDKLSEQGLLVSSNSGGEMAISVDDKLSKQSSGWKLAHENPEAFNLLRDGGTIYLTAGDLKSSMETLELFYDSPETLYKGLRIDAHYAIDGKERIVETKEEFLKYYRIPKEEK